MTSDEYKFIYTRIPKTGSTSVTLALEGGARFYSNQFRESLEVTFDHAHMHILDATNPQTKDYFKFTFVRNPWARCVSRYFWERQRKPKRELLKNYLGGNSTFAEFAKSKGPPYDRGEKRKFYTPGTKPMEMRNRSPNLATLFTQKHPWDNQLDWVSDLDGAVLVDFIGRYENLQEDYSIVCDKIGIPKQKLSHKNKTRHKHYTEYYDEESKKSVAEKYARDIEYFGYEFGE